MEANNDYISVFYDYRFSDWEKMPSEAVDSGILRGAMRLDFGRNYSSDIFSSRRAAAIFIPLFLAGRLSDWRIYPDKPRRKGIN
jgi:hypothetical protein